MTDIKMNVKGFLTDLSTEHVERKKEDIEHII